MMQGVDYGRPQNLHPDYNIRVEQTVCRRTERWVKTSFPEASFLRGSRNFPQRSWSAGRGPPEAQKPSDVGASAQRCSAPRVGTSAPLSHQCRLLDSAVLASLHYPLSGQKAWADPLYDPVYSSRLRLRPSQPLQSEGDRTLESTAASPGNLSSPSGFLVQTAGGTSYVDPGKTQRPSATPWYAPTRAQALLPAHRAASSVGRASSAAGNAKAQDGGYSFELQTPLSPLLTPYKQKIRVPHRSRQLGTELGMTEWDIGREFGGIDVSQQSSPPSGTSTIAPLRGPLVPPQSAYITSTSGRTPSPSSAPSPLQFRLTSPARTEVGRLNPRQSLKRAAELYSTEGRGLGAFGNPVTEGAPPISDALSCSEPHSRRCQRLLSEVARIRRQSRAARHAPRTTASPRAPRLESSGVASNPLTIPERLTPTHIAACGAWNSVAAGLDNPTLGATARSLPRLSSPRHRSHGRDPLRKEASRVRAGPIPPSPRSALRDRSLVNKVAGPLKELGRGRFQSLNSALNAHNSSVFTIRPPPGMLRKPSKPAAAHAVSELPNGKATDQKEKHRNRRSARSVQPPRGAQLVTSLTSKYSTRKGGDSDAEDTAPPLWYPGTQRGRTKQQDSERREAVSRDRRSGGTRERSQSRVGKRNLAAHLSDLDRLLVSRGLPTSLETGPGTLIPSWLRTKETPGAPNVPTRISRDVESGGSSLRGTWMCTPSASLDSVPSRAHRIRVANLTTAQTVIQESLHVQSFVEVRKTISSKCDNVSGQRGICFGRLGSGTSKRNQRLSWLAGSRLPPIPGQTWRRSSSSDATSAGARNISSLWSLVNSSMNGSSGRRQSGSRAASSRQDDTQEGMPSSSSQAHGGGSSASASSLPSPLSLSRLLDQAASAAELEDDVVFQMWLDQEAVLERALPLHDILASEEALERALVASLSTVSRRDVDSFLMMLQQPLLLLHQSGQWRSAGFVHGSQGPRGWARLWGFDSSVRAAGGTGRAGTTERSRPLSEAEISRNTRRWTFRSRATEKTKDKSTGISKHRKGAIPASHGDGAPPARRASRAGSSLPRLSPCSTPYKEGKKQPPPQPSIAAQPPVPPGTAGAREQVPGGYGSAGERQVTGGSFASSAGGIRRAGGGGSVTPARSMAEGDKGEERANSGDSARCCSICLAEYQTGDDMMTLRCMHMFHYHCVHDWLTHSARRMCPLCLVAIVEGEGKGEEEFKVEDNAATDAADEVVAGRATEVVPENGTAGEE